MPNDLQALVIRYWEDPTPTFREAAVLAGIPLVRSILGKIPSPGHALATDEDLESTGLVGLLDALDQYDPAHGTQFTTYAYVRIRGAIVDYLRSIDVLSQRKRELMWEAARVAESLRQELGDEPTDRQVAEAMGIGLEAYDALLCQANLRFALGLDGPATADEDGLLLRDVVADPEADEAFERSEDEMTYRLVRKVLERLSSRDRAIVALHYEEGLTLSEVGDIVGLTKGRVSQILGRIRLRIAQALEPVEAPARA